MGRARESDQSVEKKHSWLATSWNAVKSTLLLVRLTDLIVSVENTITWRLHQVFAKKDGQALKDLVVGRIASNMVFMSLLLSTTVGILFSPSDVATTMRKNLNSDDPESYMQKIIGHFLLVSIFVNLFGMNANFSCWMIVQSASKENSRAVVASTLGLCAMYLPGALTFLSINLVTAYMVLWVYVLIPDGASRVGAVYSFFVVLAYVLVVSTYSALGRLMLRTSAMSRKPIIDDVALELLDSVDIQNELMRHMKDVRKERKNCGARSQYLDSDILPRGTGADEGNLEGENIVEN